MHVVKDSEDLFARFLAKGLNIKQLLQDIGSIVQNDGIQLTDQDIDDWAVDATQRLNIQHQKQLQLITDTVQALKAMGKPATLGYLQNGQPIHELTGGIATACIISCSGCSKVIRGMGGPAHGALCPDCWEAKSL